jgi:hypothetical protein
VKPLRARTPGSLLDSVRGYSIGTEDADDVEDLNEGDE